MEPEMRFLEMGSPVSESNPLGRLSISHALDEWETGKSGCIYFDGLKSPVITEPDETKDLTRTGKNG